MSLSNADLGKTAKPIMRVLAGDTLERPPIWLMRQAGRYLPEYRAVRAEAGSFLDLCYSPKKAAEVTLQPIRRFGFDAAILFSDILVVPHAMGQTVTFVEGEGPRLSPPLDSAGCDNIGAVDLARLDPVFEAIGLIKTQLPAETALLGFCGAPWTVASYMIAGQGSRDLETVRLFAYRHPEAFGRLMDKIVEGSARYLAAQVKAGVDAVQIFDSWASVLPPAQFKAWCVDPMRRLVAEFRRLAPGVPVIGFPREAGGNLAAYCRDVPVECLGVGTADNIVQLRKIIGNSLPVQGNLDPLALVAGGRSLDESVAGILSDFAGKPHIFNLGHGILPHTPIAHVERLVALVRG
ncbi:MAG: uroporphyrinogen decarboxylase [Hyphomicrobiales bacterium]|nr:uroporphyrinogen decarboxylase [Hyphomicrobiales bacterium]